MPRAINEDLFEGTKMTFGEHLEELRIALFRSLGGLVIGTLIGLAVAKYVVGWIQVPLESAIKDFYKTRAKNQLVAQYGEIPETLIDFVDQHDLTFERVYFQVEELNRIVAIALGKNLDALGEEPTMPSTHLIPSMIWRPIDANSASLGVEEPFLIWAKVALITGATISAPWIFWQLWMFVAAGLYPQEKRYVHIFLPFSLILFALGAALAFFFVFEPVLQFLFSFNEALDIDPDPRISEWLGFVLLMPLGFGVSFQTPLVMLFLNRIGVFSIDAYIQKWRIAILTIFVLSMFLTPADPLSMLLMAIPLTVLYFLGVALCKWMPARQSPYGVGYDPS